MIIDVVSPAQEEGIRVQLPALYTVRSMILYSASTRIYLGIRAFVLRLWMYTCLHGSKRDLVGHVAPGAPHRGFKERILLLTAQGPNLTNRLRKLCHHDACSCLRHDYQVNLSICPCFLGSHLFVVKIIDLLNAE